MTLTDTHTHTACTQYLFCFNRQPATVSKDLVYTILIVLMVSIVFAYQHGTVARAPPARWGTAPPAAADINIGVAGMGSVLKLNMEPGLVH